MLVCRNNLFYISEALRSAPNKGEPNLICVCNPSRSVVLWLLNLEA